MWKTKLCMGVSSTLDPIPTIDLMKQAGFDGFFVAWSRGMDLRAVRKKAEESGMFFQSVHAPFFGAKNLWHGTDAEAAAALDELLECLRATAEVGVPVLVVHAFIGFQDHSPNEQGIANFRRLFAEAESLGVKIALENTEGEEYLDALMAAFRESPALGFCWDTGHEMCYNHGRDMLADYGEKLVATHINDNLGIRDFAGNVTWKDDLHLLPFDGIGDWEGIVDRLNRCGYDGVLTFELIRNSKPERHDNDRYAKMEDGEYYARAFAAACRVARLRESRK